MHRNVTEEAQGIRLIAAFLVRMGVRQRLLDEGMRLLQMASKHLRFSQRETTERLKADHVRCQCLLQCLCEQRYGVGDTPGQGVGRAQGRSYHGEIDREVRVLTET